MQAHAELPIVLVLGMATSVGALQQMLPVAAASMLEPQHFQLASSMERYTSICVYVSTMICLQSLMFSTCNDE